MKYFFEIVNVFFIGTPYLFNELPIKNVSLHKILQIKQKKSTNNYIILFDQFSQVDQGISHPAQCSIDTYIS